MEIKSSLEMFFSVISISNIVVTDPREFNAAVKDHAMPPVPARSYEFFPDHESCPNCWCDPRLSFYDNVTGNAVWLHRSWS